MPNWVKNIVTFDDSRILKEMLSKNKAGEPFFDFNKVVPMPKEIEDTIDLEYDETSEEAKRLLEKYGARDWYEWGVENWGTKWNSDETEIIDDGTVKFNTAWNTPEKVIKEISAKFKTRVCVKFADEDLGRNCGEYCYSDGIKVKQSRPKAKDAFKYACKVWGRDEKGAKNG